MVYFTIGLQQIWWKCETSFGVGRAFQLLARSCACMHTPSMPRKRNSFIFNRNSIKHVHSAIWITYKIIWTKIFSFKWLCLKNIYSFLEEEWKASDYNTSFLLGFIHASVISNDYFLSQSNHRNESVSNCFYEVHTSLCAH